MFVSLRLIFLSVFLVVPKAQPCLLITDVPCMIAPIAEKLHPGLLENEGTLPRNAEGQVSLAGLQHIGAYAHEFPDAHHVKVPPSGFPSGLASAAAGVGEVQVVDNVYALFADAETSLTLQPHVDFHALLEIATELAEENRQLHAADAAAGDTGGEADWSSSPQRMCILAQKSLKSLHANGCYAMTLFEVVLVYSLWFQAAGHAAVDDGVVPEVGGEEGERKTDEISPERAIIELSRSELFLISTIFMEVLRVAVGSTSVATGLDIEAPKFFADSTLYDLDGSVGDSPPPLRSLEDAVNRFHEVSSRLIWFLRLRVTDEIRLGTLVGRKETCKRKLCAVCRWNISISMFELIDHSSGAFSARIVLQNVCVSTLQDKVSYITDGLGAANDHLRQRACKNSI